jgi:hypothetical protein
MSAAPIPNPTAALTPQHYHMLAGESGIASAVITERGYQSIPDDGTGYTLLLQSGFSKTQAKNRPGLLLPLWTTDGAKGLMVYRPDRPRLRKDGHAIKYELPQGTRVRLDCPPRCQARLADPGIPIWITEGQKKADCLASYDTVALALLGVYGYNGKNAFGGITFLVDWDYVALKGREARIVYDSDVMVKPTIRPALEHLTEHLRRKGAAVHAVYLPTEQGHKVGVDDYLVAGHTLQDLEGLIEAPRPQPQPAPSQIELLEAAPAMIRRPLALIHGHMYAAIWPYVKVTRTEALDKQGNVIRLAVPAVTTEQRLSLVRDDGVVFGDGMDKPLPDLGIDVLLSEIPPQDKLWTVPSIQAYRAGTRPDPAQVYQDVHGVIDRFIDFDRSLADQSIMCDLVTCYVLATWFLDAFTVIGYLWPNGEGGSGKTKLLTLVGELGYLGQLILSGGSYACLRDFADYGATLCFDDAENVMDLKRGDPDKRALLLAGNRRGNSIPVKEPVNGHSWRTRHVQTFCPRLFSAIRLPDMVLASRTIIVPLIRTANSTKGNADPLDYALWPTPRADLVSQLWALALRYGAKLPAYDALVPAKTTLVGRALEPWRALLAVAHWLTECGVEKLSDRMTALSLAYQKERPDLEPANLTALVVRTVLACTLASGSSGFSGSSGCIESKQQWTLKTSLIKEKAVELVEREDLDMDPRFINSIRIGKVLQRLRVTKNPDTSQRAWDFKHDEIVRLGISFGLYAPAGSAEPAGPAGSETYGTPSGQRLPCRTCGKRAYWQDGNTWRCVTCSPQIEGDVDNDIGVPI